MNICLIGYGKMGKAVEEAAVERGHKIIEIIDENEKHKFDQPGFKNCDVAIEFTSPEAAEENFQLCLSSGIKLVSGTTGWSLNTTKYQELCKKNKTAFFYAPNFSIGVNVFLELNKKLAGLMADLEDYTVAIEETHHIHKLDRPSGTAIAIANDIISNNKRYSDWESGKPTKETNLSVQSFREGETIGNHSVIWDSEIDFINIEHCAKSRKGFSVGAVIAAEFIKNKTGFFTMKNLLNF